ncbi:hypothetical protein [Microtetraspora fusca]|uniref:hypothetical protein n=1 Tax=Microtetraspora fusca TaxID=1997 RepID=UPI000836BD6C|nr:hypothetical protein [Microtetraspora fusca]
MEKESRIGLAETLGGTDEAAARATAGAALVSSLTVAFGALVVAHGRLAQHLARSLARRLVARQARSVA